MDRNRFTFIGSLIKLNQQHDTLKEKERERESGEVRIPRSCGTETKLFTALMKSNKE